ncbi:MAG: AEC family transporter [Rhodospirillaceae bacterium]|nr:AEC family transporter [Rhodospirillaceae bacterium]
MSQTLEIVIPVFAVILIGYAVGKTRLFGDDGIKALTNFCFFVAIPGLLFRAMARLETPHGDALLIVVAFYAAVLGTYAVAMAVGRLAFGLRLTEQAIFAVGGTYSNILLLGLPLSITAFGDRAVLPASALLALQSPLLITVTALVVEMGRGAEAAAGRRSTLAILKSAAIALATTPVIVAMVCGIGWGFTGAGLHPILDKTLTYLGQAATPTALFALGASLTRFKLGGDLRQVAVLGVLKLLVLPVASYASAHYLFGLAPLYVAIATLCGAMPSGVSAFVLAMRYDTLIARVAASVIVTSALAWAIAAALLAHFLPLVG